MIKTPVIALMAAPAMLALLIVGGCGSGAEPGSADQRESAPVVRDQPAEQSVRRDGHAGSTASSSSNPDSAQFQLDQALLHPSHDPQAPCACATAKDHNGWCPKCNVGYIAGRRVESAKLFETLDPHGHDVMFESLTCQTCRSAFNSDGYCDDCRVGFVNHMAYFTRLTYGLAQGQAIDPADLACGVCRANSAESGWCEGCARGMVGNVAISDRQAFDSTAREYQILLAAIDRSAACQWCACAMVVHRTCPYCKISYESEHSGQPSPTGPGPTSPPQ